MFGRDQARNSYQVRNSTHAAQQACRHAVRWARLYSLLTISEPAIFAVMKQTLHTVFEEESRQHRSSTSHGLL